MRNHQTMKNSSEATILPPPIFNNKKPFSFNYIKQLCYNLVGI